MPSQVTLRDGTRAVIWSLLPEDRERLREAYEELSPESQFHRFLAPVPHLTEAMLDHLVDEADGVNHVARVLFVIDDGGFGTPTGVARMIRYPERPLDADLAVTVADAHQGRGVATALLREMLIKRPEGVERIVTEVAADNPASLAMLRRLGPTTVEIAGSNRLHVVVLLPPPDDPEQDPAPPPVEASLVHRRDVARSRPSRPSLPR